MKEELFKDVVKEGKRREMPLMGDGKAREWMEKEKKRGKVQAKL